MQSKWPKKSLALLQLLATVYSTEPKARPPSADDGGWSAANSFLADSCALRGWLARYIGCSLRSPSMPLCNAPWGLRNRARRLFEYEAGSETITTRDSHSKTSAMMSRNARKSFGLCEFGDVILNKRVSSLFFAVKYMQVGQSWKRRAKGSLRALHS